MIYAPLKDFKYSKYPEGNLFQLFAENKALYRNALSSPDYDFTGGHNGIDCMPLLDPLTKKNIVYATRGTVVEVKDTPTGYGKHVRIFTIPDKYGFYYEVTYGHLEEIYVTIGQEVFDGEELGVMGNTGFVISGNTPYFGTAPAGKGTHLHFGVRELSKRDTGWQVTYPNNYTAYVMNYTNGLKGGIDPVPLLIFVPRKSEVNPLLLIIRELLRKLIRAKGMKPIH